MDSSDWILVVVIGVLIALSAFFSATETAFSSANSVRLRKMADDGNSGAKKALYILDHYDKAISTILVGNNIVNIASSSLGTVLFTKLLGAQMGPLVSTIVMTVVVLAFGEVTPKSYAKANSDRLVLSNSKILTVLMKVATPVVFLLLKLTELVNRRGGQEPSMTEQELKYMIETIEEEGVLEEQESELVQSALEFDETTVQQVLTPRVDMVSFDVQDDPQQVINTIIQEKYSRIPVYERSIDNIIGVVQSREVLERVVQGEPINLHELVGPCIHVHKTMKISKLLNEFKRTKNHFAVVCDDYGGTLGMVTMEDLLEELVGDIWDEDDEIVNECQPLDDNRYLVSGDMNIEEFLEAIDYQEKDFQCDYNTVGGWVLEQFGYIPQAGESFCYHNLQVTVQAQEDQRIKQLLVEKLQTEPAQEAEAQSNG